MARLQLDLEHFQLRVLQDALDQATVDHWIRRAHGIAQALPRPGDYLGNSTPAEREAREQRTRLALLNIGRHITLLQEAYGTSEISDEVRTVLQEVA